VAKFREATPSGSKVLTANTLKFKLIFNRHCNLIVRGTPIPEGCVLARFGHSLACVKIWDAALLKGRNIVIQKSLLDGYNLTFRSSWVLDQNSPDFFCRTWKESLSMRYLSDFEYLYLFWRYLPPKFEVIGKGANFCMFLTPEIFFGEGLPKFWT